MTSKFQQLYNIANRSGTDKGHIGPSKKWSANNYTDIYQAYFGANRLHVKNFCEIGLGVPGPNWQSDIAHGDNKLGGGSIHMWREFFPNAKLFGLDINPATHLESEQVKTFIVDQSSAVSLNEFKSSLGDTKFDIIIDDGSHIADHQQLTLSLLWDSLAPDGYYVIEDLNDQELGNATHTKHAPKDAISTRRLFIEYIETGKIDEKNALENTDFLNDISYIALHSFPCILRPRDIFWETARILAGRGGKGLLRHEYRTVAPKMLVMQKAK